MPDKLAVIRSLLCLALPVRFQAARGATAVIVSPETAQTFSYSHITDHALRWDDTAQALAVSITFSNVNYVSDTERCVDKTFTFTVPRAVR